MVKFVNGREEVVLPELFTADVAAVGVCKRLQVTISSGRSALHLTHRADIGQQLQTGLVNSTVASSYALHMLQLLMCVDDFE